MTGTPAEDDRLIVRRSATRFEVLDVASNETLATRGTLNEALVVAAMHSGTIWLQDVDSRGHYLGDPVLVLPRISWQVRAGLIPGA